MPLTGSTTPTDASARLADSFIGAMSQLATGVVMVTTMVDEQPWGLTISACCSVSAEPPALLVSLGARTSSAQHIEREGRFGVSILGERLLEAAKVGSAAGRPKFVQEFCRADEAEMAKLSLTPVVNGALAHLDCTLEEAHPYGDHVIYIGGVRNVLLSTADVPLLYYARSYRVLAAAAPGAAPGATDVFYANW